MAAPGPSVSLAFQPPQELPRRIVKETERIMKNPISGLHVLPHEENPRHFDIVIDGPKGTCFEGGHFRLELFLPEDYPMVPPKVHFLTKIYHPNIDRVGRICLDILKDKWSPALQIDKNPNPEDPLDPTIAKAWKNDPNSAQRVAKEWTLKYASQ